MTQTPYSHQLPTHRIIHDLLAEEDLRTRNDVLHAELEEARRQLRVLTAAADSLGDMSLAAQRRLRDIDPAYAGGYEAGMVAARDHVLSVARQADRVRVVSEVTQMLSDVGLDPTTGR
ncbi:hypothetical protein [Ornithinimicrobium murale]|uniref:hypothetical protein n=1 Tax=Ornithinimicrobium murale TaxID=1050153 RepID=UPI000E0CFF07|nr:hypothetical protein [Ornithinimicrobium murale]